jgi:hypothetical protein
LHRDSFRAAQRSALGFHHRCQYHFAGIDTQTEESALHIAQNPSNGKRQLNVNIVGQARRLHRLRARLHLGGSFLCLAAPAYHMQAKGAATF